MPRATPASKPTAVDRYIAEQLRSRRLAAKLSQGELAADIGVTFQQVQKYENVTNRIAASRLWEIASALNCDVSDFFPKAVAGEPPLNLSARARVANSLPLLSMYEQLSANSRSLVARLIRTLHKRES